MKNFTRRIGLCFGRHCWLCRCCGVAAPAMAAPARLPPAAAIAAPAAAAACCCAAAPAAQVREVNDPGEIVPGTGHPQR